MFKILKPKHFIMFITILFIFSLMFFSNIGISGVTEGLRLCAAIIIPSLFPYTFAVLFLMRLGVSRLLTPLSRPIRFIFNMDINMFSAFFLSFLGGYPCGAKLIGELYENKRIDEKTANNMLLFCVNAGPGYILIAVGNRILGSFTLGLILLVSHIAVSLVFAALLRNKNVINENRTIGKSVSVSEGFISSVTDSANTVLGICFYVIIFSVINGYLISFSGGMFPLKAVSLLTEVTSAVASTRNIYLISFLLGFSGISIWCQVLFTAKPLKIKMFKFVIFRILHGALSVGITYLLMKVIKPTLPTISSIQNTYFEKSETVQTFVMLILLFTVLFISIENKITSRKIKNDLL